MTRIRAKTCAQVRIHSIEARRSTEVRADQVVDLATGSPALEPPHDAPVLDDDEGRNPPDRERTGERWLPIGVHLSAAHGQERLLLELAFALEADRPWRRIQG